MAVVIPPPMRVAALLTGEIDAPRTGRVPHPQSEHNEEPQSRLGGLAPGWDCGSCRYELHAVT